MEDWRVEFTRLHDSYFCRECRTFGAVYTDMDDDSGTLYCNGCDAVILCDECGAEFVEGHRCRFRKRDETV